jgi:hypothetical protein
LELISTSDIGGFMDSTHAFSLFEKYVALIQTYGSFEYLEEDDVAQTDSKLIWSSCSFDDGGHIINGYSQSSAVDFYWKSSKPCELEPFKEDVIEIYLFECTDCDGESDCDVCDEDSMVEIDFDRYVGSTPVSNWNADTLWAARKPYGFDYDND